jgi:hypothetical protein
MTPQQIGDKLVERFLVQIYEEAGKFFITRPKTIQFQVALKCAIQCCKVVIEGWKEKLHPAHPAITPMAAVEIQKWQQVKQYLESNL